MLQNNTNPDTMLCRLLQVVTQRPNAPALSQGQITLSYSDFLQRVMEIAAGLEVAGVGPGSNVGLCMTRGVDQLAALFAVWTRGGAWVALDPTLPVARLSDIAVQAEAKVVLTDASAPYLSDCVMVPVAAAGSEKADLTDTCSALQRRIDALSASGSLDDQLAYLIFTSGSTGTPKGVAVALRTLRYFLDAFDAALGHPGDGAVWISGAPLTFDVSIPEIVGGLTSGSHVVLRGRLQPLAPIVEKHRGTHLQCTPSQLALFVSDASERAALGRLRHLIMVGEALPVSLAAEVCPLLAPDARFTNAYGPTEITVFAFTHEIDSIPTESIPIGRALPGTTWTVVDEALQRVPAGTMGELIIGGKGVSLGYHGRPDLTAQSFITTVVEGPGTERAYRTGDLVTVRADGVLDFHGRRDHQVKVRGYRIELGEIESVLAGDPDVLLAVVQAVEVGPGDTRLLAHVVPQVGSSMDAASLRQRCSDYLPVYMVPAAVVIHEDLPRTSSGKVDRSAVSQFATPWSERAASGDGSRIGAEDRLGLMTELWSASLGAELNADDDFFERGGHSLLGVELLISVESRFGRRLPLGALVEASTPRMLLAAVDNVDEPSRSVVTMREGSGPSIVVIHGAGGYIIKLANLAQRLVPGRHIVGVAAHGLDGRHEPDPDLETMIRRYMGDLSIEHAMPDVLVGYSGGGVIAYELAAEFARRGTTAPLVVLLDTEIPAGRLPTRLDYWRNLSLNLASGGKRTYREWRAARASENQEGERRRKVRAEATAHGFVDIQDHLEVAMAAHQPSRSTVDIVLIRAELGNPVERPDFGWERLTSGSVRTFTCPGDHFSMLDLPHVDRVASIINAAVTPA
jgi:amino acid adenylation domain-containing protein